MTRRTPSSWGSVILILIFLPFVVIWYIAKAIFAAIMHCVKLYQKKKQRETYSEKAVIISSGRNLTIPVYGEHYSQDRKQTAQLEAYRKGETTFTLLPRNDYQKKHGWPEPPFANVLLVESLSVERDNWLGYIAPLSPKEDEDTTERKERRSYIRKLIKISEVIPVTVSGQVIDERATRDSFQLLLYCSRKSIDEAYKKYVRASRR